MAQLTEQDILQRLTEYVTETHADNMEVTGSGALVIWTKIYRWEDGTYHDDQSPLNIEKFNERMNRLDYV